MKKMVFRLWKFARDLFLVPADTQPVPGTGHRVNLARRQKQIPDYLPSRNAFLFTVDHFARLGHDVNFSDQLLHGATFGKMGL